MQPGINVKNVAVSSPSIILYIIIILCKCFFCDIKTMFLHGRCAVDKENLSPFLMFVFSKLTLFCV